MATDTRSYHFDFWKDKFWIWALILPFGLICWSLPFISLWGLIRDGMEKGIAIFSSMVIVGVPAYLVGYAFVYTFMEGLITKVTISDSEIQHRTPNKIFPLLWVTKKIQIDKIEGIAMNIPYGMRIAINLFYLQNNKQKKFYLPRFRNQQNYIDEFKEINERLAQPSPLVMSVVSPKSDEEVASDMLAATRSKMPIVRLWNTFVKSVSGIFILEVLLVSGTFCLQLPVSGVEAFVVGVSAGFFCIMISIVAAFPFIGQILIWFFGRKVINIIFWFFGIKPDTLFLSPQINELIQDLLHTSTLKFSLTDFIFWNVLILSILFSLDRIIKWSLRLKKPENKSPANN